MPKACSFGLCRNNGANSKVRFFKFPTSRSDSARRRLWAVRCGRKTADGRTWEPNPNTDCVFVCSAHFITGEPWKNTGHPDYAPCLQNNTDTTCIQYTKANHALRRFKSFLNRQGGSFSTTQQTKRLSIQQATATSNVASTSPVGVPDAAILVPDISKIDLCRIENEMQQHNIPDEMLSQTLLVHPEEKPYYCALCDKHYAERCNRKIHLRIYTGDRPYKCMQCGKMYKQSGELKRHLRVHSGEKPHKSHKCTQCDKMFTASSYLKKHMRIHSGKKPYKCTRCGKTFTGSDNLKKHMLIHSGEKPYKCSRCGKTFTQSGNLKTHMNKKTPCNTNSSCNSVENHFPFTSCEKLFECRQCNRKFNSANLLIEHVQVHCSLLRSPRSRHSEGQVFNSSGQNLNDQKNDTLGESLYLQVQDTSSTRSMDDVISELLTVHSQSDQYDVTMFDNNEDVKLEFIEIVPRNVDNSCELILEDIKQEVTTTFYDHNEIKEEISMECNNSLMSEVKNVFSLCENIGDWKVEQCN